MLKSQYGCEVTRLRPDTRRPVEVPQANAGSGTVVCHSRATPPGDSAVLAPRLPESQSCRGSVVTVGPGELAQFRSIAEAIRHVEPMSRILVWPGVYTEALTIDKPLEIVGVGHAGLPVIATVGVPCVVVAGGAAILHGLTLRCTGAADLTAVAVQQGSLSMRGCLLACAARAGIGVQGVGTHAVLERVRVRNARRDGRGVSVSNRASCELKACAIAATGCGVHAAVGCGVLIYRSRILSGRYGVYIDQPGLYVPGGHDGQACVIEDSEIDGTTETGIYVGGGGNHCAENVTVRRCEGNGVIVSNDAAFAMVDCRVVGTGSSGIRVLEGGTLDLAHTAVSMSATWGMELSPRSRASATACEFAGNAMGAWRVDPHAFLQLKEEAG